MNMLIKTSWLSPFKYWKHKKMHKFHYWLLWLYRDSHKDCDGYSLRLFGVTISVLFECEYLKWYNGLQYESKKVLWDGIDCDFYDRNQFIKQAYLEYNKIVSDSKV